MCWCCIDHQSVICYTDGDDENDGFTVNAAKRTVGSAVTVAKAGTVINVFAGNYNER